MAEEGGRFALTEAVVSNVEVQESDEPGTADTTGSSDTCLEPVELWDGTREAQMALSAVYRTGERFGQGPVIDVLMGTETSKVASWSHDRLSTFGVGRKLDRKS